MRHTDELDAWGGRLLPDAGDRELIFLDEAAALAGCSPETFINCVQSKMYPPAEKRWLYVGHVKGRPVFEERPQWRKGAVIAAVEHVARRAEGILRPQIAQISTEESQK